MPGTVSALSALTKQLSLQFPCFVSFFSFKRNKTGSHIGQAGIANSRGAECDLILLPPPLNCWSYQADIARPLQLPMTKIFLKALLGTDWITKGSPASYDLGRDCQVCSTVQLLRPRLGPPSESFLEESWKQKDGAPPSLPPE